MALPTLIMGSHLKLFFLVSWICYLAVYFKLNYQNNSYKGIRKGIIYNDLSIEFICKNRKEPHLDEKNFVGGSVNNL